MLSRQSIIGAILLCSVGVSGLADDAPSVSRRVYVPFGELDVILDRDGQGVMLPRKEFEELFQKAQAARKSRPQLPRGTVLSNVDYTARIAGDQLLLTATVDFTHFATGWQVLALPFHGLSVERATLNGKPAQLGRLKENGRTLQLLHDQSGPGKLTLELSAPLAALGSDKVATLGLVPAAAASLRVTLPAGKHLLIDGLSIARPADIQQQAEYNLPVGGKQNVVLRITDRRTDRTADAFVLASTRYAASVAPGSVSWRAGTSLNVFGQTIDRLVCTVPKTLEITDVESKGLEAWELADSVDDATQTTITLSYRQSFDGVRQVVLTGVMATTTGEPWTIPNLHVEGVASHVGRVAVVHPHGTRLRLNRESGVRRIAADNRTAAIRPISAKMAAPIATAANTLLFDVWQEQFTLDFVTQTKEREIVADIFTQIAIGDSGLTLNVLNQIETVYAPLFELDLVLPAAWPVTTVSSEGKLLEWRVLSRAEGSQRVRVSFPAPLAPGQQLKMLLEARLDPPGWPVGVEPVDVDLPEVRLPQAAVVEGTLLVAASPDFNVVPLEISGLDPEHLPSSAGRLGYRYQDTRFSGKLRISQRPSRISAETLTFTRLDPRALRSHLSATIEVEGGGLRSLQVALPAVVGESLRFRMLPTRQDNGKLVPPRANIIEQQAAAPANGQRIWTLKFDRRLKGQFTLSVDVETERPADEADAEQAESYSPHTLQIPAAERQHGIIAIEAEAEQRLTIEAQGADERRLEEVDPAELPLPVNYRPRARIVAVYRYAAEGYQLSFSEERFERVPVPTALCRDAQLESILGETGDFQHHGQFQITAVGVQSIGVRLPEGADLWSTLIDGRPIEVRRDGDLYLVPLPAAAINATRTLELFYKTVHQPLSLRGRIQQQPPVLTAVIGGEEQPLEVLEQAWVVRYPETTLLTRSDGRFQPEQQLDRSSLLSRIQQGFSIRSISGMGQNLLAVAIVVGVIGLLTMGFRKMGGVGLGVSSAILLVIGVAFLVPSVVSTSRNANLEDNQSISTGSMAPTLFSSESGDGAGAAGGDMAEPEMPQEEVAWSPSVSKGNFEAGSPVPRSPADPFDTPMDAETSTHGEEIYGKVPKLDPASRKPSSPANDSSIKGAMPPGNVDRKNYRNGDGRGTPTGVTTDAGDFGQQPADGMAPSTVRWELDAGITNPSARGALLSVAVQFPRPANHRQRTFKYLGNGDSQAAAFDVAYENSRGGGLFRLFLATSLLCIFWFLRRRPLKTKAILGALGITLPLALIAVTPVAWHLVLDGLFFGSLAGVLLWLITNRIQAWSGCCVGAMTGAAKTSVTTGLVFLAFTLFSAGSVSAQQQSPQPVQNQRADARRSPVDSTIVIPYSPEGDPLTGGRVFLPQEKFRELWNDAYPDQREKTAAPVEGLVAGAVYSASLAPGHNGRTGRIAVRARFVLHSFRDHQITLPLPLGAVATRSATLDGKPAPLLVAAEPAVVEQPNAAPNQAAQQDVAKPQADGSSLSVVVTGAGLHLLDVEFDLPAQLTGPAGAFTVPLQPVAAGKFTFTPPAEKLTFRVNGASSAFRLQQDGDTSLVEVPVDTGGRLRLSWQPAQQRGGVDNIVHSDAVTAAQFNDAGLTMTAAHQLRVRQGSLSEVTFNLPDDLKLKTISGPDVGGWGIDNVGDQRILRVFLRRAIDGETKITCELFQPLSVGEDPLAQPLPAFAPREVTREIGTVGVIASSQFLVRGTAGEGISQINVTQFTPPAKLKLRATPELAYRYTTRPFELNLSVARRRPETRAEAAHAVFIGRRKINVGSTFDLNLQETPRSRLAIQLPDDYLPLEVNAADLADWYVNKTDDNSELIVELKTPRTGQLSVSLVGTIRKEPDDTERFLILPYPLGVNRLNSSAAIRVDDFYVATLGDLGDWKSVNVDRLSAKLRNGKPVPQFALISSVAEPIAIELNLKRAEVELDAASVSTITVGDADIGYRLELLWTIKRAATDRFTFTVPQWLKGKLQIRAPGLRRVIETDVEDSRTRYEVLLQEPVAKRYYLMADAILPPPKDDTLQTPVPVFVRRQSGAIPFASLETQQHYVLVVNLSRNQVSTADRSNLEEVTADDLPIKLADASLTEQASDLVRLSNAGAPPEWTITKFEHERGAEAIINLAALLTVVERDGSYRTQVTYSIRNRTRQYLAVQLPPAVKLLSVFVKGKPSRTVQAKRKQQTYHLVPLASTSQADLSFDVKLVYSGKLKNGDLPRGVRLAQTIDLPGPRIPSVKENADFGIPVGRTTWQVFLPDDYHVSPYDDIARNNFTESTPDRVGLYREMVRMKDYLDLSSIALSSGSSRTRYEAANNMKQLGLALHNYHDAQQFGDNDEVRQYNTLQSKVQQQARDISGRIEIDDLNRRANIVDDSKSMTFDEKGQKDAFRRQSEQQFQSNSVKSIQGLVNDLTKVVGKEKDIRVGTDRGGMPGEGKPGDGKPGEGKPAPGKKSGGNRRSQSFAVQNQELNRQRTLNFDNNFKEQPPQSVVRRGQGPNKPNSPETTKTEQDLLDEIERVRMILPQDDAGEDEALASLEKGRSDDGDAGKWTQAGGLSLAIQIPTDGQVLSFSKVSGEPRLALSVRPRESVETGFGLIWTAVWIVLGVAVAGLLSRAGSTRAILHGLPKAMVGVGLVVFFLFPQAALAWLGFVAFVLGAIAIGYQHRHPAADSTRG